MSFMNTYVDKRTHLCYNFADGKKAMKKHHKFICILLCLISLTCGFLAYVFFRPDTYFHDSVQKIVKLPENIADSLITYIFKYYLSDFAWAYSLNVALSLIHSLKTSAIISFSFGVIWEIMQKMKIVKGTFDIVDILVCFIAVIISVQTIKSIKRRIP